MSNPVEIILNGAEEMDKDNSFKTIKNWCMETLEYHIEYDDDPIIDWAEDIVKKYKGDVDPVEVSDHLHSSITTRAESWLDDFLMHLPNDLRNYIKNKA
jgi:hypothetical protein